MSEKVKDLVDLFQETIDAHHKAYLETDGVDPEWPLWYADYLSDKLPQILGEEITKSEMVYALVLLSKEQPQSAPQVEWQLYYARYFISNYS